MSNEIKSQNEYRARLGFYNLAFATWKTYSHSYRVSEAGRRERKWLSEELQQIRCWESTYGKPTEVHSYDISSESLSV